MAFLAAAAVSAIRARGDGDATGNSEAASPAATSAAAHSGVCQALTLAKVGDIGQARRVFSNRSHQALHDLAAAVEERSRAASARLLEAKARVESGLERQAVSLPNDLAELGVATARAIEATGAPVPEECTT